MKLACCYQFFLLRVVDQLRVQTNQWFEKNCYCDRDLGNAQNAYISLDDNDGLGLWTEQAGESGHREFLKIWSKYKVTSFDNPRYGERVKNAVTEFSSIHI